MATICSDTINKDFLQVGGQGNDTEIIMKIKEALDTCFRYSTQSPIATDLVGGSIYYDKMDRPEDALSCAGSCKNLGTLYGEVSGTLATVTFQEYLDANEIANGLVNVYVNVPASGTYDVVFTIGDYTEGAGLANADIYTYTLVADAGAGFYPVTIDLGAIPSAIAGTGWGITTTGVSYSIAIDGLTAGDQVGFSTIDFYSSVNDLKKNYTLFMKCIESISGDDTVDVIEEACSEKSYDSSSISAEITLSFNQVAGDFDKLNPTLFDVDATSFKLPATATQTAVAYTDPVSGIEYASIQVSEMDYAGCGDVSVIAPDDCGSLILNEVSVNTGVALDNTSFIVLSDDNGIDNRGRILLDASYVGKTLSVLYMADTPVESVRESRAEIRDFLAQILIPMKYKNGRVEWRLYDNVLVTSFPWGWSANDSTTRELTLNVGLSNGRARYTVVVPQSN